jgi:hypothetical protein
LNQTYLRVNVSQFKIQQMINEIELLKLQARALESEKNLNLSDKSEIFKRFSGNFDSLVLVDQLLIVPLSLSRPPQGRS